MVNIFIVDVGGRTVFPGCTKDKLTLAEPAIVKSKVESDIFGELITRDGSASFTLGEGGGLPDSPITDYLLKKHLTLREQIAYYSIKRFVSVAQLRLDH